MTLHEYINRLIAIQTEHGGDAEVVDSHNEQVSAPEYMDDDGDPVVVVCDLA